MVYWLGVWGGLGCIGGGVVVWLCGGGGRHEAQAPSNQVKHYKQT